MENVSAEMQKDKSFAISCGWTEPQIIVDDNDLGVSGQLRMEDRKAFNAMLRRIANGEIKAVVVFNVDRLFRNRWGDESGKFMEICHTYGVFVVTPDSIYDFRISWHIDRFKRRCEEAWNYLEYHIYGRMLAARDERAYSGFWSGGSLPAGYILDLKEKLPNGKPNPQFFHYIPYEPHAKVVRWLFKRYKELNGNLTALMIEIEAKRCLFPDFEADVDPLFIGKLQHMKVEGGYTLVTIVGLRKLLTNRAYIGWWIYKGEVISRDNHDAIVDLATFTYAYNRISMISLDGTPNQRLIERRKTYAKRHHAERPAVLKDIIKTDDPKVSIYTRNTKYKNELFTYYGFCPEMEGKSRSRAVACVDAADLDMIVLERLREHLRSPEAEKDFQEFTEVEPKAIEEAQEELKLIEQDIEATKANMARITDQVESGKLTDPDLAQAANKSYEASKQELKRLEERKAATEQIAQEDNERRTYRQLMRDVDEAWNEVVFPEEYPRLVYLFIKSVTLARVSPNYCTVRVEWKDPTWDTDEGLFFKGPAASPKWEDEEIEILEKYYPTASWEELAELLPRRSRQALYDYYHHRKRENPRRAGGGTLLRNQDGVMPYNICLKDWKVMQEYNISVEAWKKFDIKNYLYTISSHKASRQGAAVRHIRSVYYKLPTNNK